MKSKDVKESQTEDDACLADCRRRANYHPIESNLVLVAWLFFQAIISDGDVFVRKLFKQPQSDNLHVIFIYYRFEYTFSKP